MGDGILQKGCALCDLHIAGALRQRQRSRKPLWSPAPKQPSLERTKLPHRRKAQGQPLCGGRPGVTGANVEHALRDKSAKWSFKKGDDPSKMGSAKESTRHRIATLRSALIMLPARSPPPSSDAQRRSDEPSSAKAAASASEGTPPQSPRRGACLLMRFCPPQHAILAGVSAAGKRTVGAVVMLAQL